MAARYDIIDTHIHYWEPDSPTRPWDKDGVNTGPPCSVEQLLDDAAKAGVTKIVQVTPSIMGYDNRYGIEGAQRYPERIVGVIGRFDPTGDDMPERLARYLAQPKIIGARITLIKKWERWLADGLLDPFFAEAGRKRMPVQLYAARQAKLVGEAAHRYSETTFLLDHMMLSRDDRDPFAQWADVLALADAPNVYVKVSYFPEVAHEPYPFKSVQPYFKSLYERFGPDRLVWGSNYPPSREACSYKESVDFARQGLSFLNESDKAKIFGETFLRAVGLS